MNRKGFVGDIVIYLIMLFVLSLALLVIYYFVSSFNTAWQGTGITGQAQTMVNDYSSSFVDTWDFFYLFLVVGFALVVIILAFALRSHPVFAMFTLLFIIILGIVAVHFSNAFYDIASISPFSSTSSDFTFMSFLATRLPHIVVIFGVLFIIILYAKTRSTGVNL